MMDRKHVIFLNNAFIVLTIAFVVIVMVVYKVNNWNQITTRVLYKVNHANQNNIRYQKGWNNFRPNRSQITNDVNTASWDGQLTMTSTVYVKDFTMTYAATSSPDINNVSPDAFKESKSSAVASGIHMNDSSQIIENGNVAEKVQSTKGIEKILWESIDTFHQMNFERPENETCEKRFPSCIIIGVAKCGTRELTDFLRLHPHVEIYKGKIYEMPYFSRGGHYSKGLDWLKMQMPFSYSNQITIMKNAWYFHSNKVPERIAKFNQSIKLILLVREPISRLISHYRFLQNRVDVKKRKPLSGYVLNSKDNTLKTTNDVISMSLYKTSMERWLKYFNLSQILIINSDDLKHDPPSVLKQVEDFLGLGHYIQTDMFVYNAEKQFYCIRSNLTSTGMACYGDNRGNKEPVPKQYVSPEVISKLKEYYQNATKDFLNMTGKSFDW